MISERYMEQLENLEQAFAVVILEMRLKPVEETMSALADVYTGIGNVIAGVNEDESD